MIYTLIQFEHKDGGFVKFGQDGHGPGLKITTCLETELVSRHMDGGLLR